MKALLFRFLRAACALALCAVTGLTAFAGADKADKPLTPQRAYEELLSVSRFAFGGVGFAGTTSEGEIVYRAIAASTNALQLFSSALTNGTVEAKLYALCGIRRFAPATFADRAQGVVESSAQVMTMSGCIVDREQTSNVVARIGSGVYDAYIKTEKPTR